MDIEKCERYAVCLQNGKYVSGNFYGNGGSFRLAKLYFRLHDAKNRAKKSKGMLFVVSYHQ